MSRRIGSHQQKQARSSKREKERAALLLLQGDAKMGEKTYCPCPGPRQPWRPVDGIGGYERIDG